jgi:hypothetical protein
MTISTVSKHLRSQHRCLMTHAETGDSHRQKTASRQISQISQNYRKEPAEAPHHTTISASRPPQPDLQLKQVLQQWPFIQLSLHFPQPFCCAQVDFVSGATSLHGPGEGDGGLGDGLHAPMLMSRPVLWLGEPSACHKLSQRSAWSLVAEQPPASCFSVLQMLHGCLDGQQPVT